MRGLASTSGTGREQKDASGYKGDEEEMNRWLSWLQHRRVEALFQAERTARQLFRYPPTIRRIKILVDKDPIEQNDGGRDSRTSTSPF